MISAKPKANSVNQVRLNCEPKNHNDNGMPGSDGIHGTFNDRSLNHGCSQMSAMSTSLRLSLQMKCEMI